jgi:tetratricopeptide (TPR) repeat protein
MAISRVLNKVILICVLIFGVAPSFAQTTDAQLAAYYYREGDFEKAVIYFERLHDQQPSDENYNYLLKSYLSLDNFKDAEKLAEKQSKNNPQVFDYQVDIGNVLKLSGETSKANKQFDKTIKNLGNAQVNQFIALGRSLSAIGENDRALDVYEAGRKVHGKSYPFNFQIAPILGEKGDINGMIKEYIDVLDVSTGYLQSVQNTLNRIMGFDTENKYTNALQTQLLEKVQKNSDNNVYAEMLIWMYMQQNKFEAALLQAKAIDKRNKEEGDRVLSLADLALNNLKYQVAIDGYDYVKNKGPRSRYYLDARQGLLSALQQKIVSTSYDQTSINKLNAEYQSALDDLGYRDGTWRLIKNFAHVKAFYESKFSTTAVQEAIQILQNGLAIPGLNPTGTATLKIELADIYVLTNNIWDASLLYGQVEKTFKYDEIGYEAKLKNAKVFYYSGDFGWAEAQLSVLKGSTSKLIANDALELSVFITENTGLDTTTDALSLFSKTELLVAQHKYDSAQLMLNEIETMFPGHALADNILYQRAKIFAETGDYENAVKNYMRVAEVYSSDILADNALLAAGKLYEGFLNQPDEAMKCYTSILENFTSSLFTIEARKRLRKLRGDAVN